MILPQDVVVEILSRLPVRSLIRYKCVCKSWHSLFNNPIFISHHYLAISSTEDSDVLLVSRRSDITNKRVISLLRDGDDTFVDQDLPPFLNNTFGHVRLIGPCNGIVCLYGYPDNIALWNPILRDFKMLPPSQVPRPEAKVRFGDVGFGFDSIARDFKVMQILYCISSTKNVIYQVEMYSLRSNSWRKYECNIPVEINYFNLWSMVYKNETFCWWADDNVNDSEVILSFDMRREIFQTTPLPYGIEALGGELRITRAILPMKEYIGLIVYGLKEVDKTFKIWILKELGGNIESWTKISSIGPISNVKRPLGFRNEGKFFLENSVGELIVYDSCTNEIKNFGVYGKRNRLEVLVYKKSLFSVNEVYVNE